VNDLITYPTKASKFGVEIWNDGDFQVFSHEMKYEMFKGDYSVGRIIRTEFEYVYKSDFKAWLSSVKAEAIANVKEVREILVEGEAICLRVEKLWNNELQ